jgi:uncharacterized linocin/CFP29 family protein
MDDRSDQVGWTEAQWNRVREEVLRAWQRVRVAGSFLSVYGPLPASTQVVPSEVINPDGTVDDRGTADLLEIALPVTLTRQQVREEDLSSALLQFSRRATQVGQLEDWYVFNGTYSRTRRSAKSEPRAEGSAETPPFRPAYAFLAADSREPAPLVRGAPKGPANLETRMAGLLLRNPGALGLIEGPREANREAEQRATPSSLDNDGLISAVVGAINSLEEHGYVAPYVCVFGRHPFEAAYEPIGSGTALPRDRLEPLIGRELQHASAIDVPPTEFADDQGRVEKWRSRGVLLSLAGDSVDLAIAAEATPEFRQVDAQGRYVFSVFERFALRIKDLDAIAPLTFKKPSPAAPTAPYRSKLLGPARRVVRRRRRRRASG